jgi:hypothetical protein
MIARIGLGFLLMMCGGCFQIDLYAPHGQNVYLVSSKEPLRVKRQWREWFVLFGLVPLSNITPDMKISEEQLTDVRLITIDTVPDAFIGFIYNVLIPIGLVNQSVLLEGNRADTEHGTPGIHGASP